MYDYINNRKFYTSHSEFLSGDREYTGYVIRSGDKYTDLHGGKLTHTSTFSSDLFTSDYFRDRIVSDILSIPNPLSAIQINVNDIITDRLVNEKFSLLHENSLYLYKSLQVPSNYIPSTDNVRYAALSTYDGAYKFEWHDGFSTSLEYGGTPYSVMHDINHGIGITSMFDKAVFSIFCTTSSSFVSLTGSNDTLDIVEQSPYIEQNDNQHKYVNITSMDHSDGNLYICDQGADTIYKYDITSYLNGDNIYYNRRILVDSVGTRGTASNNTKFNAPSLITVKSDRVAVYDSGNKTIKIFDTDFNFITKISAGNFRREPAVSMRYNKFTNELYVITITTSRRLRLYRVQHDLTVDQPIDLAEVLSNGEYVKEIAFSANDSNYWYLVTTKIIYKKLVNKPINSIGSYDNGRLFLLFTYIWNYSAFKWQETEILWNSINNKSSAEGNYIGITCEQSDSNVDTIFILKYGRFYKFNEPNEHLNILDFFNSPNYSLEDISLSTKEYIQPIVYNKEIYKLAFNLLSIKNNIIGKYYGEFNIDGIYRLLGYDYSLDLSDFNITNINNFILHQNESINYYTVNRTLSQICKLQQILLDAIAINVDGLIPYIYTSNMMIVD